MGVWRRAANVVRQARASKGLDLFNTTMLAIANKSVDLSLSDPEVRALWVGTSEAFGLYSLRGSPPAFHLTKAAHRCTPRLKRVGARETTGGAVKWSVGLEQAVDQSPSPLCL
jgi:hypothetical protein